MKTNYFILLILLFSFSLANAQSTVVTLEEDATELNSITDNNETVNKSTTTEIENEVILENAETVIETIVRSRSDIKIYFNQLNNVDNLNLLFPKINKAKTA